MESEPRAKRVTAGSIAPLGDPGPDSSHCAPCRLSNRVPRTMRGEHEAIALGNVQDFNISDKDLDGDLLQNMYSPTEHDVQIEISSAASATQGLLHQVLNEWSGVMPTVYPCVLG